MNRRMSKVRATVVAISPGKPGVEAAQIDAIAIRHLQLERQRKAGRQFQDAVILHIVVPVKVPHVAISCAKTKAIPPLRITALNVTKKGP